MNRIDERQWAKEMMIEFIDESIKEDAVAGGRFETMDDLLALLKQRNRIARFLGIGELSISDLKK